MSGDKDKYLMRVKDIVLIVGAVGGFLAGLGKIFVLAKAVDSNEIRLTKIEPVVASHETRIAVSDTRWEQIQKQVEAINKKLDRGNRDWRER